MKKFTLFLLLFVIVQSVILGLRPAMAQEPPLDPEAVIRTIIGSLNEGDIDTALTHVAEHAVSVLTPPPPGTTGLIVGKEEFQARYENYIASNEVIEFTDFHTTGSTATWRALLWADNFRELGVAPVSFEGVGIVKDGLLQTYTWTMTDESKKRFQAALKLEANKRVVQRFYDEIWNEGNLDVIDEIIASDFEDLFVGQTGKDKFKGVIKDVRSAFPDLKIEYEDMVAEGDMVVVRITAIGTYQGGMSEALGIPDSVIGQKVLFFTGVDYAEIRDGKMVRGWGTHDGLAPMLEYGYELVLPDE